MRMSPHLTAIAILPIGLVLPGCSVIEAPIDLATSTIETTGNVVCATCEMTADIASAVGTTTRAIADVATNSAVQKAALESPSNNLGEIVTQAIK